MREKVILTSIAVLGLVILSGCASEAEEPPAPRTYQFSDITNGGSLEYFSVTRAEGISDEFGDRLTLFFDISNTNGIVISPVATISFEDGSELVCTDDDSRRHPSLVESTTDWEFPCDGFFPDDVQGALVTVEDDYH